MQSPLISIIIPVYNVETYLKKCIDSVLNQTYTHLEIILVDDGSNDRSGQICDEYAKKDDRILVIHKKNGGLSEARNVALDVMSGRFVTFVDSDDYIEKEMIEILYKLKVGYDANVSCVGFEKIFDGKEVKRKYRIRKEIIRVYSGNDAIEEFLYKKNVDTSAWGKLYNAEDFKEIKYPVGMIFEDLATTYKIFEDKSKIVCSNLQLYYYVQRSESIVHDKFSIKRFDRIIITKQILTWAKQKTKALENAAIARLFIADIQTLREIPFEYKWDKELRAIIQDIKKYRRYIIINKKIKFIDKLIAISTYLGIKNVKRLGKLYKILWP